MAAEPGWVHTGDNFTAYTPGIAALAAACAASTPSARTAFLHRIL
jgi:hypothetical protein